MMPSSDHICPVCSSTRLTLIRRGFAGKTDTADQYWRCLDCQQTILEIVSLGQREIRLGRFEAGGSYQRDGLSYSIRRILKVGFDEFLLYLQLVGQAETAYLTPAALKPGSVAFVPMSDRGDRAINDRPAANGVAVTDGGSATATDDALLRSSSGTESDHEEQSDEADS